MEPAAARDPPGQVAWLPWSGAAFARARAERAPVLLAIGAAWCRGCAEIARVTYRDPAVCDLIARRFVPVAVDADRRPDVSERYSLGGWPTTAFLTPAGQLLGGETFVDPERMATLLERVAEAFAQRREEVSGPPRRAVPPPGRAAGPPDAEGDDSADGEDAPGAAWLERRLLEAFDPAHGGFGTAPKRAHAPAVRFCLRRAAEGRAALREAAARTLDAIGWGGLYDDVDGGVFRYCAAADWTAPRVEKLLAVNADALDLLLEGWRVLGEPRYRERAADLVRYVRDHLADRPAGGFFASQFADESYYAADAAARARRAAPPVDRSVYADGAARMAAAFLRAAEAFDDSSPAEFAVAALERVVGETYERGGGVAHAVGGAANGSVRGLLADQVEVSAALLEAYGVAGRDVHLDVAQELMRFAMRALWDDAGGGFVDRVVADGDVGLLREPLKPFDLNCAAARVLVRLAGLTGSGDFRDRAAAALAAVRSDARRRGIDAAPWVLAALDLRSSGAEPAC